MKNKGMSTYLCKKSDKNLSGWERAIADAKRQIAALKKSIRSFEYFRESGVPFPEPKKRRARKVGEEASQ